MDSSKVAVEQQLAECSAQLARTTDTLKRVNRQKRFFIITTVISFAGVFLVPMLFKPHFSGGGRIEAADAQVIVDNYDGAHRGANSFLLNVDTLRKIIDYPAASGEAVTHLHMMLGQEGAVFGPRTIVIAGAYDRNAASPGAVPDFVNVGIGGMRIFYIQHVWPITSGRGEELDVAGKPTGKTFRMETTLK